MILEEVRKESLRVLQVVRRKAPEVHRYKCTASYGELLAVVHADYLMVLILVDVLMLGNVHEVALGRSLAYATAHTTLSGERALDVVSDHTVGTTTIIGELRKVVTHRLKSLSTVEVVSIDYCKRAIDLRCRHHQGVVSTPWLGALGWSGKALGQRVYLLIDDRRVDCLLILL